jgi:large subunit ribosomal protein L27
MAHVKAGGTSKNVHDSPGQRLGIKVYGGQTIKTGSIILRQVGQTKLPGVGTKMSRDFTIHAARDGVVEYRKTKRTRFSGQSVPRTEVSVVDPQPDSKK